MYLILMQPGNYQRRIFSHNYVGAKPVAMILLETMNLCIVTARFFRNWWVVERLHLF